MAAFLGTPGTFYDFRGIAATSSGGTRFDFKQFDRDHFSNYRERDIYTTFGTSLHDVIVKLSQLNVIHLE